ncbi:MAG: enoyl-CoA hydratase [Chloroflexi bacterium]|nr:enoyl-CoA hydratase [Chloroflexota bacterium]
MADDVLFEKRPDGVGVITLNRPDSLNAMGGQLMTLLAKYLADCTYDTSVRCVVLTGAGRAFCAGGDVKGMGRSPARAGGGDDAKPQANDGGGNSTGKARRPSPFELLDPGVTGLRKSQMDTSYVLHTMLKPTIAMVNGHAVGAGLSLALACDIRIASDKAKLGTAFRNIALSGDFGGSFYMQRLVGSGKARELYFTGEIMDADEALRIGLVNRVVPHDRLVDETMAFAANLAAGPTATLARTKENLNLGEYSDLRTLLDQEAFYQRFTGLSNDSREAVSAFIEKRQPKFAGN